MGDEYILGVGRVATQLGIEVRTAVAQTAIADNLHHCLCQLVVVNGELVGVPSVLSVTAVGVDRTEHAIVHSHSQFVLECVTCQSSVINLDVHLEVFLQSVGFQETDNSLRVNVILMLCWLHRLRLDEERSGKSLGTCIVTCCSQHLCKMVLLTLHLCV